MDGAQRLDRKEAAVSVAAQLARERKPSAQLTCGVIVPLQPGKSAQASTA